MKPKNIKKNIKIIYPNNKHIFQIYQWCLDKHPFINNQIIYEHNLKNNLQFR